LSGASGTRKKFPGKRVKKFRKNMFNKINQKGWRCEWKILIAEQTVFGWPNDVEWKIKKKKWGKFNKKFKKKKKKWQKINEKVFWKV
jgi:hypothetical protein